MADNANVETTTITAEETAVAPSQKTFTQEDIDRIVTERIARERKGRPSDEELNEFRAWKTQKQTDAEKMAELSSNLNDKTRELDERTKERDNVVKDRDRYKTEKEKLKSERDTATGRVTELEAKLTQIERERYLLGKGVPEKDLDYYVFKIAKEVTDENPFEKAAEAFLQDFEGVPVAKFDTGANLSGGASALSANEQMNQIFRKARRM